MVWKIESICCGIQDCIPFCFWSVCVLILDVVKWLELSILSLSQEAVYCAWRMCQLCSCLQRGKGPSVPSNVVPSPGPCGCHTSALCLQQNVSCMNALKHNTCQIMQHTYFYNNFWSFWCQLGGGQNRHKKVSPSYFPRIIDTLGLTGPYKCLTCGYEISCADGRYPITIK